MRTRIVFHLWNKGGHVPFHHQYLLAEMIKGVVLSGNDAKFIDFGHYNFSGLKGQTQVSRKGLHFYSNKVTLVFSCNNKGFTEYFLDNLFELQELELGGLRLSPEFVEEEESIPLESNMKYICISPVVLAKPEYLDSIGKTFIHPEDDTFSDKIYESTMFRMEQFGGFTKKDIDSFYQFQLIPDKDYLIRLEQKNKKYSRVYPVYENDEKYEVRGYTFPFTLYADPTVQEFLFTNGLGILGHKGFGMLDIANSDPSTRVVRRKELVYA